MVHEMDATCSFALLLWRQALGTLTGIVGGDQLCAFNGDEIVCWKTIYTCYRRIGTIKFSYEDSTIIKEIDQMVKSWKQTFRVNMGLIANKVTLEFAIWKVRRPRNLVIPPAVEEEFVEETPQEGPSDLEIVKQVFEEEKKKMRIVSRKQQEKIKRWWE